MLHLKIRNFALLAVRWDLFSASQTL